MKLVCVYTNTSLGMYKTSLILVCTKHWQHEDANNWRFIAMDALPKLQYKINSFKDLLQSSLTMETLIQQSNMSSWVKCVNSDPPSTILHLEFFCGQLVVSSPLIKGRIRCNAVLGFGIQLLPCQDWSIPVMVEGCGK
ncbi:hypothetical protein CMV_010924 [Castanea mollissima]|uniref:Uncharacterized protein n=1 Tax=Castanea mollissima TaxID=60419 RepID=A0A8J4R354_9ROSI|nr:hypothetical protein CMV_010924 [Castanea mollissima]